MKYTFSTEDKEEALRITKSLALALTLLDIDNYLREQIKYHDKDLDEVRDELYRIMRDRDIALDELVS